LQRTLLFMKLLVGERTAAIESVLDVLQKMPLAENGRPVRILAAPATSQELSGKKFVVITEAQSLAAETAINKQAGILYVGATAGVAAKSVLRNLLIARELPPSRIAAFGTRQWSLEEHDFVRTSPMQLYTMLELSREGLTETVDAVMSYVRNWPSVHLVLNLDVVDPAFAPGLRSPAPGGLTSRELIYLLQRLLFISTLTSVEIILDAEPDALTTLLCAKLLAECISQA
jgi:hypothetical protein